MFKVVRTEEFEKRMNKLLTKEQQQRVDKIEDEIAEKGFVGDPLGSEYFREKRISGKRVYFLVSEDFEIVLMVSVSDKKTQQETIDKIKTYIPEFRKLVENISKTI